MIQTQLTIQEVQLNCSFIFTYSQVEQSCLGTKVTSDNFRAIFETLSFSQPVYSLFAADEGTNHETAGRTAIKNTYMYIVVHHS